MSGTLFDKYGAILNEDVQVLEDVLTQLLPLRRIRMVEIGMHAGATARGVRTYLEGHNCSLDYTGIDPDTSGRCVAWDGAEVLLGDSAELHMKVNHGIDLLWVDGCHCRNHVMLDILNYSPKVNLGGFMCFHDINPTVQGKEKQYHGPDLPEFHVDVVKAIEVVRFPWDDWYLWKEKYPLDAMGCGTRAYRNGL